MAKNKSKLQYLKEPIIQTRVFLTFFRIFFSSSSGQLLETLFLWAANLRYKNYWVHCKWRAGENPIWMSYFESHSLSNQIEIDFKVSIHDLLFSKLEICMLVIYVNSWLNRMGAEGRAGNCRQPLLGGSSLPFSPLLWLSPKFSCKTGNRDSKWDQSREYLNRSQIHECRNWWRGRAVSFLGVYVSNFRYSV